jgi:hypothetical protein
MFKQVPRWLPGSSFLLHDSNGALLI